MIETRRGRANAATSFLVVAGAISAGVHAGLVPRHLHEWVPLGISFILAATAIGAAVAAVALRPSSVWTLRALAALLFAVVAAFVLTRLTALPPLDPAREPLDLLGGCITALELAALAVAIHVSKGGTR